MSRSVSDARVLPMGERAALVETDGDPAAIAARVRALVPGVVEVVPAARTVLVTTEEPMAPEDLAALAAAVQTAANGPPDVTGSPGAHRDEIVIAVRYDGDDLDEVASTCGITTDEVVRRHTAVAYRVAFCGFAPGFAYLAGLDPSLHLPRRSTPRARVPAGSVAIAAAYSAVYPSVSPGGWHLLGRTELVVWDVERRPPAVLTPGAVVRFVEAGR